MHCYILILAKGGRNSKQPNKLQSKGHNYLTGIMHYWKRREVLGGASHYMRGVKSCEIMSVSTGLNCLCAGYLNPAEKSITGIMAFAASGRFLLLVPERRAVRVSLEMMAGLCQRLLQTHGTQHRWENKTPMAENRECVTMTCVP